MFNALKKLVGNDNQDGQPVGKSFPSSKPGQPIAIDRNLQKMFSKGVHYNMKIVIKGDRNVGKSCLWKRLQGSKFDSDYKPTEEIQVCHIQWSYKATDDIVKVEIWDVVDKGRKRKPLDGLKLNGNIPPGLQDADVETALDAEFIDVYKGTNGVIMMLDMTKLWTFDYVQKELPKVPKHIPVLVLANHLDMKHHRVVSEDQVKFFIEGLERAGAPVRYAEASMSNGFGLKFLHKFFNVPFLQLQREALIGQLERNQREIDATCEELDLLLESEDANYDRFVDQLGQRRRQVAENFSNATTMTGMAPVKITGGGVLPAKLPKSVSLPAEITNTILNKGSTERTNAKPKTEEGLAVEAIETGGGDLNKFFEEDDDNSLTKENSADVDSDDEDGSEINGNPLVCGFQDELDPEDLIPQKPRMYAQICSVVEPHTETQEVESKESSLKESPTDASSVREEFDESASPADWRAQDLDDLESKVCGRKSVSPSDSQETSSKESRSSSKHKSSKKSKKDKSANRDSSDTEKPSNDEKKKKEEALINEKARISRRRRSA